eukprot:10629700-Ditylum_brightwellii.AAC.1
MESEGMSISSISITSETGTITTSTASDASVKAADLSLEPDDAPVEVVDISANLSDMPIEVVNPSANLDDFSESLDVIQPADPPANPPFDFGGFFLTLPTAHPTSPPLES